MREDDILLSVNGVSVDSLDRLKQIVASLVVGEEATVHILRDGQEMDFSFVIQSREELTWHRSLPQVYQMSTIKPPEVLDTQGLPGDFLYSLERYVYQMSTNKTF